MSRNNYKLWREKNGLERVRRLAEEGLCDEVIATALGLDLETMRLWLKRYPEFAAAIKLGSAESDYEVVNSLYMKATGHSVPLKKTYKLKRVEYDPETGKKLREFEELATGIDETFIPADLGAEKYWLKSRQPERWGELLAERETTAEDESEVGVVEIPVADKLGEGEPGGFDASRKVRGTVGAEDGNTDYDCEERSKTSRTNGVGGRACEMTGGSSDSIVNKTGGDDTFGISSGRIGAKRSDSCG